MKQSAPKHIIEYCDRDNDDSVYAYLYETFGAETSFVYKVKCTCNCEKFIVYQDAHPSVFAKCCNCGNMITVYDLEYYPAAVKLDRNYAVNKMDENSVRVYVNYEYSDEFLDEEDVEFDANDITWAKVFIANNGAIRKILDDETC